MGSTGGKVRVAVNGYGVIGKRVAEAVSLQSDMVLVGVADVASDWRLAVAVRKGFPIFGATPLATVAMQAAGLPVRGEVSDLLAVTDIVVVIQREFRFSPVQRSDFRCNARIRFAAAFGGDGNNTSGAV